MNRLWCCRVRRKFIHRFLLTLVIVCVSTSLLITLRSNSVNLKVEDLERCNGEWTTNFRVHLTVFALPISIVLSQFDSRNTKRAIISAYFISWPITLSLKHNNYMFLWKKCLATIYFRQTVPVSKASLYSWRSTLHKLSSIVSEYIRLTFLRKCFGKAKEFLFLS